MIERLGCVTISISIALLRTDDTSQSLIERADNRLYAAKRQWRDRVICETDPDVELRGGPEAAPPARVRSHHCEIAPRYDASLAGSSWTDSPQPHAAVWFGLLKMNCADSFSTL